jgi:phage recombination protein Bet
MDIRKMVVDSYPRLYDEDIDLYIHECERRGVDPLSRLIVPRPNNKKAKDGSWYRGGPPAWITSIDLMRARADETGKYAPGSDTEYEYAGNGTIPDRAKVFVKKFVEGVPVEFSESARWIEFYPGDGMDGAMWRKMPEVMLSKVAEARALRRGWPAQLQGLYEASEFDQADAHDKAETSHVEGKKVQGPATKPPPESPEARHAGAMKVAEEATTTDTLASVVKRAKLSFEAKVFNEFQFLQLTLFAELLSRVMVAETDAAIQSVNKDADRAEKDGTFSRDLADIVRHRGGDRQKWIDAGAREPANDTFSEV